MSDPGPMDPLVSLVNNNPVDQLPNIGRHWYVLNRIGDVSYLKQSFNSIQTSTSKSQHFSFLNFNKYDKTLLFSFFNKKYVVLKYHKDNNIKC